LTNRANRILREREIDVDGLINALEYQKDSGVRRKAAWALNYMKDPKSILSLIAALKNPHYYVRENAAYILGRIKDLSAVYPLIIALRDSNHEVRKNAVIALSK
jgi:HEAT repeat protein